MSSCQERPAVKPSVRDEKQEKDLPKSIIPRRVPSKRSDYEWISAQIGLQARDKTSTWVSASVCVSDHFWVRFWMW